MRNSLLAFLAAAITGSTGVAQTCACIYGYLAAANPTTQGTFYVTFESSTCDDGYCSDPQPPCYQEAGCYIDFLWIFVPAPEPAGPGELDSWAVQQTGPGGGISYYRLAGPNPVYQSEKEIDCGQSWEFVLTDCGASLKIICTACMNDG